MVRGPDIQAVLDAPEPSRRDLMGLVVALSVPAVLAEVCNIVMEYIDAAMVGSMGAGAIAAIGLIAPVTWLQGGICSAATLGFTVQVAQYLGAGRRASACNVTRQGIVVLAILAALLCAASVAVSYPLPVILGGEAAICRDSGDYLMVFSLSLPAILATRYCMSLLQCAGDMRTPSRLSILACFLDVAFNFLLIFPTREMALGPLDLVVPGAGLGVLGSALGTGLAYYVVAAMLVRQALVRSPDLAIWGSLARGGRDAPTGVGGGEGRPGGALARGDAADVPSSWRLTGACVRNAASIALPMAFERTVTNAAQILSTAIVAPLGTTAVAAHTLAITAEGLCYMPGFGIAQAATTLVGQSFGAGRRDLSSRLARLCLACGMAVMAFAGALMFVGADVVLGFFTPDGGVRELGASVLRVELIVEPLFGAAIVGMGALRGAGDALVPSIISLVTMWGIRITLSFALTPWMGLAGVWVAMAVELAVRGSIMLARVLRGRWLDRASMVAG